MNFINNIKENDLDLFFGPLEDESFTMINTNNIMAHLVTIAGVFPSVSQARKNGWNKEIPFGFTDIRVGKNKTRITILNIGE